MPPFFHVPLDLPHAGTVASRIVALLDQSAYGAGPDAAAAIFRARQLHDLLFPHRLAGDNPAAEEAERVRQHAARLGRNLVDAIEAAGLGEDRLGQCVRNLFECLELGEEGAAISLRAGENPASPQRPV